MTTTGGPPTQLEALEKDLSSFADPGTELEQSVEDGWQRVAWHQDGRARSARFHFDDEPFPEIVEFEGSRISYRSFLAGSQMADLRAVARNILNVVPRVDNYVSLIAQPLDVDDEPPVGQDSRDLILRLAVPGDQRTNVIFVSAQAGVGKTTLLRELVRERAAEYLRGQSSAVWLYVDAQGRRLAQLDEAIAAELDDVRARFPYHATTALVRTGALVLVVDGFDELIGSVGSYDEAYSSLASFISDLHGYGCLVASARSSYYEQEFLSRANKSMGFTTDSWILKGVRLLDWNDAQREDYIRRALRGYGAQGRNVDLIHEAVQRVLEQEEVAEVSHKPFFVSRTVDIIFETAELPSGPTLLDRLVAAYIAREVEQKLRSPVTGAPMLTAEQYRYLLAEIAEEMWHQETRELSRTSVRELVSIIGELMKLDVDRLSEIVQRLPDGALLSKGNLPGSVAFEHDIYYSYFLAEPVALVWAQSDSAALGRLLRRGRLPEEAAYFSGRRMSDRDAQPLMDTLAGAIGSIRGDAEQVRRNAGYLAAGLLEGGQFVGLLVKDLIIGDAQLRAHIEGGRFERCQFIGSDLTAARLVGCTGVDLMFDRVLVDPRVTVLGLEGAKVEDFFGLGIRGLEGERYVFSPVDIRLALQECGLPAAASQPSIRAVRADLLSIVEKLCRVFMKTNAIVESLDDEEMRTVLSDPGWPDARAALLGSGVLTIESKQASGQKVFLKRHYRPEEIMAGEDRDAPVSAAIREFWDTLEAQ